MMESRILECAIKKFLQLGIKSVTMDMIASDLGVSKKTIYAVYKNKNELISKCVDMGLAKDFEEQCALLQQEDFMEQLIAANKNMFQMFETISPVFFYELEKLYPKEFEKIEKHKFEKVFNEMLRLYEKGKQQGYVRPELDIKVVITMRMEQISDVFDSKNYERHGYSFVQVQKILADFFMYGVLTEKGLNIYKQSFQSN